MPTYYEFFAGGGMASAALRDRGAWTCLFANDFDSMKADAYRDNWGSEHFRLGDVAAITPADLPGHADLCWASTPCQDLSLAGDAAGLGKPDDAARTRSGAFWPWWRIMEGLAAENRLPRLCVFENVVGALASNGGRDFEAVARAFSSVGYSLGAMVIDARHFLPQSRPRLFVVGAAPGMAVPPHLAGFGPEAPWHPEAVTRAYAGLPPAIQRRWTWWRMPIPSAPVPSLSSLIEDESDKVPWNTEECTARLLGMMTAENRRKVATATERSLSAGGKREVGTLYRRTRADGADLKRQRAEVRFDGVAGCLRTASGGSSRQTVVVVEGERVRTRLLSPKEAARLMGLPEAYRMPRKYNDAYHLAGDGVAVPVVRHLAANLLEPLLAFAARTAATAHPFDPLPKAVPALAAE